MGQSGCTLRQPFSLYVLLALGSAVFLTPYALWSYGTRRVVVEGRKGVGSIVIAGALTFLSYSLLLLALQFSRVSYVLPSRAVGIVVGVVLGTIVLREPFGKGRIIGSCLIVLGLALIALAP